MNAAIAGMNQTVGERELAVVTPPLTPAAEIAVLKSSVESWRSMVAWYRARGRWEAAVNASALADRLQARIGALEAV